MLSDVRDVAEKMSEQERVILLDIVIEAVAVRAAAKALRRVDKHSEPDAFAAIDHYQFQSSQIEEARRSH